MRTHISIVAVIFVVLGGLGLIAAFFMTAVLGVIATVIGASHSNGAPLGAAIVGLTGVALSVFLVVLAIPSIVCGWGLLRMQRWARILGIILAAIGLIRFPIGTIFGVYALWVLFNRESEALFAAGPSAVPSPTPPPRV